MSLRDLDEGNGTDRDVPTTKDLLLVKSSLPPDP